MKISLLAFIGSAVFLPAEARPQSSTRVDSAPAVFALVKTDRAGISGEEVRKGRSPIAQSNADSSHFNVRARLVHALHGTVLGAFGGAVIGGLVGWHMDSHADDDAMIPASALLAGYGAIIGAGVGLLAGALWPTK